MGFIRSIFIIKYYIFQVEKFKNEKSYDEKIKEKYGEIDYFDDYNKNYDIKNNPSVLKYDKSFWLEKKEKLNPEKLKNDPYYKKFEPAQKLGDEYLIKKEDIKKKNV